MKILLVKLNAMGDVLNVTPCLRLLKNVDKNIEIDFLTGDWAAPALENNPYLRNLYILHLKYSCWTRWKMIMEVIHLLAHLRKGRYDGIILFQKSKLFLWLVYGLNVKNIVMYSNPKNRAQNCVLLDETKHVIINHMQLTNLFLNRQGIPVIPLTGKEEVTHLMMDWFVTETELQEAKRLIENIQQSENHRIVAVFPGGGNNPIRNEPNIRQWGRDKFRSLVAQLCNMTNVNVLLLGSASERELCDYISHGHRTNVSNLAGKLHIRISAAVVCYCNLVITNDSGPMHIAGALHVPVVSVFGPTGKTEKLPFGENIYGIQSDLPCSPCYYTVFHGCLFDKIQCMERISVDTVFHKVCQIL